MLNDKNIRDRTSALFEHFWTKKTYGYVADFLPKTPRYTRVKKTDTAKEKRYTAAKDATGKQFFHPTRSRFFLILGSPYWLKQDARLPVRVSQMEYCCYELQWRLLIC